VGLSVTNPLALGTYSVVIGSFYDRANSIGYTLYGSNSQYSTGTLVKWQLTGQSQLAILGSYAINGLPANFYRFPVSALYGKGVIVNNGHIYLCYAATSGSMFGFSMAEIILNESAKTASFGPEIVLQSPDDYNGMYLRMCPFEDGSSFFLARVTTNSTSNAEYPRIGRFTFTGNSSPPTITTRWLMTPSGAESPQIRPSAYSGGQLSRIGGNLCLWQFIAPNYSMNTTVATSSYVAILDANTPFVSGPGGLRYGAYLDIIPCMVHSAISTSSSASAYHQNINITDDEGVIAQIAINKVFISQYKFNSRGGECGQHSVKMNTMDLGIQAPTGAVIAITYVPGKGVLCLSRQESTAPSKLIPVSGV
jgi:hypothetical protein